MLPLLAHFHDVPEKRPLTFNLTTTTDYVCKRLRDTIEYPLTTILDIRVRFSIEPPSQVSLAPCRRHQLSIPLVNFLRAVADGSSASTGRRVNFQLPWLCFLFEKTLLYTPIPLCVQPPVRVRVIAPGIQNYDFLQ